MGGRGASSLSAKAKSSVDAKMNEYIKKYLEPYATKWNMNAISKKQAGVIYGAQKRGELDITEQEAKKVYSFSSDLPVATTDTHSKAIINDLQLGVQAVFNKDYDVASAFIKEAYAKDARYYSHG